jgi:hypothetical protein
MRRIMLVVAVVALVLAVPTTASAHKLRKGFSAKQAREVAQNFAFSHFFFTENDIVSSPINFSQKQFCSRASKHKVFCGVGWLYEDAFSDSVAECIGESRSKLRRHSNIVATRLTGEPQCQQVARANARGHLEARIAD